MCNWILLSPQPLEARSGRARVPDGVSDIPVAEIILNEARIVISVGQVVPGGVAEHVRINMKTQLGAFASFCDEVIERLPGHRAALTKK